jgi:hypothetical protein
MTAPSLLIFETSVLRRTSTRCHRPRAGHMLACQLHLLSHQRRRYRICPTCFMYPTQIIPPLTTLRNTVNRISTQHVTSYRTTKFTAQHYKPTWCETFMATICTKPHRATSRVHDDINPWWWRQKLYLKRRPLNSTSWYCRRDAKLR